MVSKHTCSSCTDIVHDCDDCGKLVKVTVLTYDNTWRKVCDDCLKDYNLNGES